MNENLLKAVQEIGKADAIMYAIEKCYLDIDDVEEEQEIAERRVYAFYALWDAIHNAKTAIDEMSIYPNK